MTRQLDVGSANGRNSCAGYFRVVPPRASVALFYAQNLLFARMHEAASRSVARAFMSVATR